MIPKGTNVVVNFYATDSAGVPLSRASGITPYYRLNGGASDPLGCNIYPLGSDAPGWFRFSTSHFNTSVGNLFITFKNSSGYIIMPWEDDIVPTGGASAADIWSYSFSGKNASTYLYNASNYANSAYTAVGNINIPTPPTTNAIATSVWGHAIGGSSASVYLGSISNLATVTALTNATNTITGSIDGITIPTPPDVNTIANSVWDHAIGGSSASVYLGSISGLATTSNITDATDAITTSIGNIGGWATPGNVTDATTTITGSIDGITIPTPPTAGDIATSVWDHTWGGITASTRIDSMYSNIEAIPDIDEITSSVWGNSSGVRSLNNSFYGTGTDSRFAVKNDIQALPGGLTAADVWNYPIVNNISARTYLTTISTSAASIPGINTNIGTINTSIGNVATSIGTINTSIGTITGSIGTINTSIGYLSSTVANVNAGLFNWSVEAGTLTTYIGNTSKSYSLSRDGEGNIIRVEPRN